RRQGAEELADRSTGGGDDGDAFHAGRRRYAAAPPEATLARRARRNRRCHGPVRMCDSPSRRRRGAVDIPVARSARDRPLERNREHQGEHFTAAIAHHHLTLQTELKRSTSLPSAMFDANDPMLEARLCEATEGIFRRLLEHDTAPAPAPGGEV